VSWYCSHPGCERRGVWKDEDTGLSYCDGHTGVIDEAEQLSSTLVPVREEVAS
jgi:hypothetical protein